MNSDRIFILICLFGCFISKSWAQSPLHLTLKEALQSVDTVNFQVIMANARLEEAIARISEAQSDLLPHVEGDVSGGRQTSDMRASGIQFPGFGPHIGPYNNFDARARVTIDLFDPSAFERFQAAKKGENLSSAQLEKIREDILALVADLFIDAQRKRQTVKLLKILLVRDQMAFDLSEDKVTQGTGTVLDSNIYKSDLDQTKYLYKQAQLQAEESCMDLEAALQLPLDEPLVLVDDKEFINQLKNNAGIDFNNATNADTVLASSELESIKADQNIAKADFLPKVSGSADYGRLGESPSNGSNTYDVGVAVSVPLWEGGAQQAKLKEVKGEVKEAQANVLDTNEQARVNIAKARAAIDEADELMHSKIQNRQTAQKALLIAFHAHVNGTSSVLDVMSAKSDLATAEDEYNEAQATWVMAHIDLLHAEGKLRELVNKGE